MNGRITDRQFLLAVLSDGKPHTLHEIITASVRERGHAFTVHSRAADLRKFGYTITNTPMKRGSIYQLVVGPLEDATPPHGTKASRPGEPQAAGVGVASSSGPSSCKAAALDGSDGTPLDGPLQTVLDIPRSTYEVAA